MDLLVSAPRGITQSIPAGRVLGRKQAWIPGNQFSNLIKIPLFRRREDRTGLHFFRKPGSSLGLLLR